MGDDLIAGVFVFLIIIIGLAIDNFFGKRGT